MAATLSDSQCMWLAIADQEQFDLLTDPVATILRQSGCFKSSYMDPDVHQKRVLYDSHAIDAACFDLCPECGRHILVESIYIVALCIKCGATFCAFCLISCGKFDAGSLTCCTTARDFRAISKYTTKEHLDECTANRIRRRLMLLLEPMKGDYRAEMVQRKRLILETCGFGDLVEMYRLGFVETPQPPVQTKRKRNAPCFAVADEKPELEDSKKHKQQQQQQQQEQQQYWQQQYLQQPQHVEIRQQPSLPSPLPSSQPLLAAPPPRPSTAAAPPPPPHLSIADSLSDEVVTVRILEILLMQDASISGGVSLGDLAARYAVLHGHAVDDALAHIGVGGGISDFLVSRGWAS